MEPADFLAQLPLVVAEHWGETSRELTLLTGGMNSSAAILALPSGRFVAKWVPGTEREALERGARTAQLMTAHGIRAGAPLPTRSGDLTVPAFAGELVLLEEVVGAELSRSPADQRAWGSTLAAVHAAAPRPAGRTMWEDLRIGRDPLQEEWVQGAVSTVRAEYDRLPPLSWALLHTDPAPEAFLRDARGDVGVIDWTGSIPGPVLYDVASAVMYAGGEEAAHPLLDAYRNVGVIPDSEIEEHLPALRRMRGVVQAVYFSQRVRERDLTGVEGDDDNLKGLNDAREMLDALGVDVR